MLNKFIGLAILMIACNVAFAGNSKLIKLLIFNYTNNPGIVFLGTGPIVFGPSIGINGTSVEWTTVVNGKQAIGLQVGSVTGNICFLNGGEMVLNAKLYQGDTITILYGQQQIPTGIACGCYGSACDIA